MDLNAMGRPPRRAGSVDQGLSGWPTVSKSLEPLCHQPICPGSVGVREHVLVVETLTGLSNRKEKMWEEMRNQRHSRNVFRRIRGVMDDLAPVRHHIAQPFRPGLLRA